jgi:hypothetical protein
MVRLSQGMSRLSSVMCRNHVLAGTGLNEGRPKNANDSIHTGENMGVVRKLVGTKEFNEWKKSRRTLWIPFVN